MESVVNKVLEETYQSTLIYTMEISFEGVIVPRVKAVAGQHSKQTQLAASTLVPLLAVS